MTNLPAPIDNQITHATRTLREVVAELDNERANLAAAGDTTTLADGLEALDTFASDLRTLIDNTKTDLAELLADEPGRRYIGDGYAVERSRTGQSIHWDSPGTLRHVLSQCADRALDDLGDVTDRDLEVVSVLVASILTGLSDTLPLTNTGIGWRLGGKDSDHVGLRGYMDDDEIDEYRTVKRPGRYTVRIVRNQT